MANDPLSPKEVQFLLDCIVDATIYEGRQSDSCTECGAEMLDDKIHHEDGCIVPIVNAKLRKLI